MKMGVWRVGVWMHTTSFGGTSPRVFLQKVVRSEMGYMTAWGPGWATRAGDGGGEGNGEKGERGNI